MFLFAGCLLLALIVRSTFPFLAVTDPKPGSVLVVEGWVPDYVIGEAMAEFHRRPYEALIVSGGPIEKGAPFFELGTYAHFGAATAVKMGFDPAKIHAVPSPETRQDRTYSAAVAVRDWLRQRGPMPLRINVASLGPHTRRTRMLYQKAFAGRAEIGCIAVDDRAYDGRRWWMSSSGFRSVTGEVIAYAYARLLFRAPPEHGPNLPPLDSTPAP